MHLQFTMTVQTGAINFSLPQVINLNGNSHFHAQAAPYTSKQHRAQLGRDAPSPLPKDSGRQRPGILGIPHMHQLQTPQAVPPYSLEYISLPRGRATALHSPLPSPACFGPPPVPQSRSCWSPAPCRLSPPPARCGEPARPGKGRHGKGWERKAANPAQLTDQPGAAAATAAEACWGLAFPRDTNPAPSSPQPTQPRQLAGQRARGLPGSSAHGPTAPFSAGTSALEDAYHRDRSKCCPLDHQAQGCPQRGQV